MTMTGDHVIRYEYDPLFVTNMRQRVSSSLTTLLFRWCSLNKATALLIETVLTVFLSGEPQGTTSAICQSCCTPCVHKCCYREEVFESVS